MYLSAEHPWECKSDVIPGLYFKNQKTKRLRPILKTDIVPLCLSQREKKSGCSVACLFGVNLVLFFKYVCRKKINV